MVVMWASIGRYRGLAYRIQLGIRRYIILRSSHETFFIRDQIPRLAPVLCITLGLGALIASLVFSLLALHNCFCPGYSLAQSALEREGPSTTSFCSASETA